MTRGAAIVARVALGVAVAGGCCAGAPTTARAGDDAVRVLVDRRGTVPARLWAELEASGEAPTDQPDGLPASASPGTPALRARRGGRSVDVLVFVPDEGGWQVRASIPFGRHDADADAVRASEVVRALRGQLPADPPRSARPEPEWAPRIGPTLPAPPVSPWPPAGPPSPPAVAPPPSLAPPGFAPSVPGRLAVGGDASSGPPGDRTPSAALPRVDLALGPAIAFDATGLAPALETTGRVWIVDRVAVGAFARPSLAATTVEAAAGAADLLTGHAGASLALAVAGAADPRGVVLGLDVGVAWLVASGTADAPFRGVDDADAAPSFAGRLELRQPLGGPLTIGLALTGGAVIPSIDVRFADRAEATWGSPFGAAAVKLGLAL